MSSAKPMLIVDTGPLVAYLNRRDTDHARCAELLDSRTDELLVTPYVVTEACYLICKYVGPTAEINIVEAIAAGDLTQVDITTTDVVRMAELMAQYRGFPLGVTDASVIAISERLGLTEVATLDHRHFHAVTPRHTSAFKLLP
ncbi:type II toxin-antitoxin system VapC family toxin [Nocardia sp. GCM10030253]|uniref:type II toxin-antitoxin system VapC family toxin n=1 Tax=Nocardia sp. GCM10030253 TaxID=3273404 RepID=UPI00363DF8A5